jgi:hypothetical protein
MDPDLDPYKELQIRIGEDQKITLRIRIHNTGFKRWAIIGVWDPRKFIRWIWIHQAIESDKAGFI